MSVGIRVLISVKDHNGESNTEYGYIMRRLQC